MTRQATSEEKLLKLIRKKKHPGQFSDERKGNDGSSVTQERLKKKGVNFLGLGSSVFLLISFGCAAYIASNYFLADQEEDVSLESEIKVSRSEIVDKKIILPEMKPFSFYEEKLEQRDIFEMPWEKPKNADSNVIKVADVDLGKQLKIVGIVLDKDPKAIVEDVKTGQTFFMSEGERVEGAMIEKIQEDKVIFIYNDKKVELVP